MPEVMSPYAHVHLGPLAGAVEAALSDLTSNDVLSRMRRADHTVWSAEPTEISEPNGLGWLLSVEDMQAEAASLRDFAASVINDGYTTAVLLGTGGFSSAAEVLHATFGRRDGWLGLHVLDTTHPDTILSLADRLKLDETLFIVAGNSDSTIETMSLFRYFWDLMPEGAHFIAITDPDSDLQRLGEEHEFRRVFLNRTDIPERYSALSYVGLVPAALIGVDLDALLATAADMTAACEATDPAENPGAYLGVVMGEAALAGRDKLTLFLPPRIASFGNWVEQLLAGSTGREGKGIIPIVGETAAPAGTYGDDRLFVVIGVEGIVPGLEAEGHPVIEIAYDDAEQLGAEFFRWEFATAVAGDRLHINPFEQPDVQTANDTTNQILADNSAEWPETPSMDEILKLAVQGDYICFLAYLPTDLGLEGELQHLRLVIRDRLLLPTVVAVGPRYLQSTGQLHKYGPNSGVFVLITDEANRDAPVLGTAYTFDRLRKAQALGDLQSLLALGRRVGLVQINDDRVAALRNAGESDGFSEHRVHYPGD